MSGQANDSGQEKSFDPTPARLEKARRQGDIALSREANAAAAYAGLYIMIVAGAGGLSMSILSVLREFHDSPSDYFGILHPHGGAESMRLIQSIASAVIGMFAVPAVAVIASLVAQQGFVFAPTKLSPKWSRLSLVDNAKQKFGPQGLYEFTISAAKLFGILALFAGLFAARFDSLPGASMLPAEALTPALHKEAVTLIGGVLIFSAIIAWIDVVRVRASHQKRLMMSLDEIRRENKETDGDPHMKQNRRERSRAIATNRMLLEIPRASVVIVNPTHYAVALKWDGPKKGAPVLLAKGADEMAAKIREIAAANGVPIRHDASAARAIFGSVDVGQEIRREHYAAVAAAIHFADTIRAARGVQ